MRLLTLVFMMACSLHAATYYVTVSGLGGTPEYESQFEKWAGKLQSEFARNGATTEQNVLLRGPAATRAALEQALARIANTARAEDEFALFLIGHGTFDGVDYKFNMPGPDITAGELAAYLNRIPASRQLVVDMSSASGAAVPMLAHKGRIVITATKSGNEKNATVFPRYWVDGLEDPIADTDKNGSLSTLELYRYTTQKVAAYFEAEKLLATEHALFTDTASSAAVREPKPENGQGLLAARFDVLKPAGENVQNITPEKRSLIARKQDLEVRIDRLKYAKAAMDSSEYKRELTQLLIELARTQAEIDR